MTDTEILDYLQESVTHRSSGPCDVRIGSVVFTLGVRHGTLREKLEKAIAEDKSLRTERVTKVLLGEAPAVSDHCIQDPTASMNHRCSRGTLWCTKVHA